MIENIKKEYLDRMKKDLTLYNYNLYLESLNNAETHGMTINFNKLKDSSIDIDYLIKRFCLTEIFINKDYGYYTYDKYHLAQNGIFPGKDPLYYVGLYYIQEPSAARVLSQIEFKTSDIVLDLCASPGGKSIQVLYSLDSKAGGFLISNEIDKKRVKILNSNIERMGFDNVAILSEDSEILSNRFENYFDKILVDAPCSGEGMFRKSDEAINQWSLELVNSCSKMQKKLIDDAYKMLKSGGTLIYSTCTFSKDEDEEVIDYIIDKYNDLEIVKMEKNYPFNSIGEGQFYAIIKKNDENRDFLNSINKSNLTGLNIIRYGIEEWEDKSIGKNTHATTHNNKFKFKYEIDLNDEEVYRYLKGEVIKKELDFKGFCKVTYKRLGLGLAKYVQGSLKNHYPKGLRIY